MPLTEQQSYVDKITRETAKLSSLKKALECDDEKNQSNKCSPATTTATTTEKQTDLDNEDRAEKVRFEIEMKKEAEERRGLLQAIISESQASGFPIPPSLIRLLNSNNGNYFYLFFP